MFLHAICYFVGKRGVGERPQGYSSSPVTDHGKTQGSNVSSVNLLSYPVTVEDVRATVKGMASGRAGGPDSLTYEMFQAVLESDAALRVLTDGISTMLTPEGMADSRISRTFKGAITTLLPKPDKEEEELEMVQNQRPITLRTALFKISTVLLKKRFMGALEAAGTVDAEQQGFRCRRSARRAVHALQNLIWDAQRAKKKILLISLDWRNFFGSISQDAFLAVAEMVGFSSEDVSLLRAFYKDTSLFVRTDGGDSAQIYLSRGFFQGDVFSPDAATLMSVLLIRMLKYSGCFCEHSSGDGRKLVNAVVFADDSTLVVTGDTNFEIQQRAQKLLDTVAQFADLAATALNLGKSFATGRDF